MLKKLFIAIVVIVVLLASVPAYMFATGAIGTSSLRMMLNVVTGMGGPATDSGLVEQRYRVPAGFQVELYASNLPRARFLRFTPMGDLLVSRPHSGDITMLLKDRDGDGRPDGTRVILEGLSRPLGMDFLENWLYVAESNRVGRIAFDTATGLPAGAYETVIDGLTDNGNHWSKTLRVGPDQKLYLAQGSTCNVCEEEDPRRATLMRFNSDGSDPQIIATGLRNAVGFDWAPWNGDLYATDNGRDLLGDDFPPCELNLITGNSFYGWPYFNGANVPDPDMGKDPLAAQREPVPPAHAFRAHNAPLGIAFVDTTGWPAGFERSALVALHGSWNRSEPDGYKVVSLHWSDSGIEERDFLSGFNLDGDISGRPVDVAQGPDGAIYISDDYAGAIYRVSTGSGGSSSMKIATPAQPDDAPPQWLASADTAQLALEGANLYQQYDCASCHEAGENPALLDDLHLRMNHTAVIEALRAPQSPMPVFPLTDQQHRALAVFLLQPKTSHKESR